MNDAGYIFAGYFSTFGILAAYATWVIRRKRTLSQMLRPEDTLPAERRRGTQ